MKTRDGVSNRGPFDDARQPKVTMDALPGYMAQMQSRGFKHVTHLVEMEERDGSTRRKDIGIKNRFYIAVVVYVKVLKTPSLREGHMQTLATNSR